MELPSSLPESLPQPQPQEPQLQPQAQEQPQSQSEHQPQSQSEHQPQSQSEHQPQPLDPQNPQLHDQSQHYPQQQQSFQDYYYQNQPEAYGQSYYAYYHQYPYLNQWQYPQLPQDYAHQQPDYSAAYPQPLTHQSEPAPTQLADASGAGAPPTLQQPQHHQQSAYPPVQTSAVPPGVNPAAAAAIAALQQLTQFAGTMDAAERASAGYPAYDPSYGPFTMHPPDVRHPQRGRGRRGGQRNGSAPPSRGRGRGRGPRGRGRSLHGQPKGAMSSTSHPEPSEVAEQAAENAAQPEKVAPNQQQVQIAWCELCRVDCTTLEILEQHKNGKRHKKNLLRFEELKNKIKPGEETEIPSNQETTLDPKPEASQQPQVAQNVEEQKAAENLPAESAINEPMVENNQQNDATKLPEVPAEASNQPMMNKFDNRRHGMKHKMKGGRGGKRMRTSETQRRPKSPKKPKVVIPLLCDLCNVKCDTREVLDRHLSGKKHIAKLKRFEGHQAMYGPQGLQVLYPPNPIAQQTHFIALGHHQPFGSYVGPFPSQSASFPPQAPQPTASLDPQVSQSFVPQVPEAIVSLGANPTAAV